MNQALFLNGVFDDVLREIITAQSREDGLVCYLQPYKNNVIRLLKEGRPSGGNPITFYASETGSLDTVRYTGEITGWMDKRELKEDADRVERLNAHMRKHQPDEHEIYFHSDADGTKECANLLAVRYVKRLQTPVPVTTLVKVSDRQPHRVRTRSGGWSVVYKLPDWIGEEEVSTTQEQLEEELEVRIKGSSQLTMDERLKRLKNAPTIPATVQVISRGFRRNADVVMAVLARAKGMCEECHAEAPFRRAKDGTPYLEIHHKVPLAQNGEDTMQNAIAVCPNCHMRLHYGIIDSTE
jgi:5-methylcytosine-specific restriction protein A